MTYQMTYSTTVVQTRKQIRLDVRTRCLSHAVSPRGEIRFLRFFADHWSWITHAVALAHCSFCGGVDMTGIWYDMTYVLINVLCDHGIYIHSILHFGYSLREMDEYVCVYTDFVTFDLSFLKAWPNLQISKCYKIFTVYLRLFYLPSNPSHKIPPETVDVLHVCRSLLPEQALVATNLTSIGLKVKRTMIWLGNPSIWPLARFISGAPCSNCSKNLCLARHAWQVNM
jgi:hypothetical protein